MRIHVRMFGRVQSIGGSVAWMEPIIDGSRECRPHSCDLLEVRWLLSEAAARDVGDEPALAALAQRATPDESAANLAFVDVPTEEVAALTPELLDELALGAADQGLDEEDADTGADALAGLDEPERADEAEHDDMGGMVRPRTIVLRDREEDRDRGG